MIRGPTEGLSARSQLTINHVHKLNIYLIGHDLRTYLFVGIEDEDYRPTAAFGDRSSAKAVFNQYPP